MRHHVDAGDVQADDLGGIDGAGRHGRMHPLGHVDGRAAGAQIGVAADQHRRAGRRNRIGREALIGQHGQGHRVELDLAQYRSVMFAAAGIGVHLLDQLHDGVNAVAEHVGRLAAGGRHHAVAYDQQAIIVAGGELLDQNLLALQPGGLEARATCSRVVRLVATPRPWLPSCGLTTTGTPISHAACQASSASSTGRPCERGHAHGAKQHPRHFLVLGDRLGDGAGAVGLGGLDAALFAAVAEEHQAVFVQPAIGNAAGLTASTIARVLGPRHTSWARLRSRSISPATLKGRSKTRRHATARGPPSGTRGPPSRRRTR